MRKNVATTTLSREAKVPGGGISFNDVVQRVYDNLKGSVAKPFIAGAIMVVVATGAMPGKVEAVDFGNVVKDIAVGAVSATVGAQTGKKNTYKGVALGTVAGAATGLAVNVIGDALKQGSAPPQPQQHGSHAPNNGRWVQVQPYDQNAWNNQGGTYASRPAQAQVHIDNVTIINNPPAQNMQAVGNVFSRAKLSDSARQAMIDNDRKMQELQRQNQQISENPNNFRPGY